MAATDSGDMGDGTRGDAPASGPEGGQESGADQAVASYPTNTGNGTESGSDPLGDIFAGLAAAEIEAANIMAEATRQAAEQIKQGMEAAAKATIESAKIASAAVLEQAEIADDRIREFWNIARSDLKPIIDQGRYASDEMASMMGIKDSNGQEIPFDYQDLANTPGFQYAEDKAIRALQNSAVGTALSGQNLKNTVALGQSMAMDQYNNRLSQLGFLAEGGWGAARDQANAATQTANTFAQVHTTTGSELSDIAMNEGHTLASIYTGGSTDLANTYMSGAESRVGLITGLATAGANLQMAQLNNQATIAAAEEAAKASKSNSMWGALGTIGGALIMSDESIKEAFVGVDVDDVLVKLAGISVTEWQYIGDEDKHMGPMAQDFKATFDLGDSDKHIQLVDANGVLVAAVQALYKRVVELERAA